MACPQENLDIFRKMVEYWARFRDRLEDGEITESEYYLKEIKFPKNPVDPDKEYTVSLNLDDDDQLMVQNINKDEDTEETAELLKDLFPNFSYVTRKRKTKKDLLIAPNIQILAPNHILLFTKEYLSNEKV